MADTNTARIARRCAIAVIGVTAAASLFASSSGTLTLASTRITVNGTTNVHPYTVATTTVRLTRLVLAGAEGDAIEAALQPGAVQAFEIAIPAASLTSPKDGVDKNMHKALKVEQYPDITFRLTRLEPRAGVEHGYRAAGTVRVAGIEKEIAFDLAAERKDNSIAIHGEVPLVMTDFGVTPPKAMLGMLKTDPKVIVQFETVLN